MWGMSTQQIAFAISMALVPLALFLLMAFLACFRVLVARCFAENRITLFLLTRVDRGAQWQTGTRGVGSGRGDFWSELTHEFRALYK